MYYYTFIRNYMMNSNDLKGTPFINIMHNMSATRVYYIKRLQFYFVYTMTPNDLVPINIKTASEASEYLYGILKSDSIVDLTFNHPKRLHHYPEGVNEQTDLSKKILLNYLVLLLI